MKISKQMFSNLVNLNNKYLKKSYRSWVLRNRRNRITYWMKVYVIWVFRDK